ncbi:MAG: inositol monophosphatase [Candidatus Magasanikbacteria bacterium]
MQEFLKQIIREAGYLAKGYYHEGVEKSYKGNPSDIVTVADRAVSDFLIKKIRECYPDHGIISEEVDGEINPGAEYTWVIDPIDGTRNFANHISLWCTLIGVTKNNQPYLGAIYDAINDELYFAEVGKGAFLNDRPIKVSDHHEFDHNYLVFSAGYGQGYGSYNSTGYKRYYQFLQTIMGDKGHWIHNFGTMLSVGFLAAGRADAVVLNCGFYHDYLAPYVIATEAGAKWTNSFDKEWKKGEMDIVVANPILHKKIIELFK